MRANKTLWQRMKCGAFRSERGAGNARPLSLVYSAWFCRGLCLVVFVQVLFYGAMNDLSARAADYVSVSIHAIQEYRIKSDIDGLSHSHAWHYTVHPQCKQYPLANLYSVDTMYSIIPRSAMVAGVVDGHEYGVAMWFRSFVVGGYRVCPCPDPLEVDAVVDPEQMVIWISTSLSSCRVHEVIAEAVFQSVSSVPSRGDAHEV